MQTTVQSLAIGLARAHLGLLYYDALNLAIKRYGRQELDHDSRFHELLATAHTEGYPKSQDGSTWELLRYLGFTSEDRDSFRW